MASGRVGDDERAEIIDAIRSGRARNDIARDFGRGPATISRIAADAGLTFERATETAAASEARQKDFAARRTALRDRCLDEASQLLDQLHEPHIVIGWYKGEAFEHQLPAPDTRGKRDLAIAFGIVVDKAMALDRDDADGFAAVDAWLRSIVGEAAGV